MKVFSFEVSNIAMWSSVSYC